VGHEAMHKIKTISTTMKASFSLLFLLSISFHSVFSAKYNLADDYSGATFFDRWDYYGNWDNLTLGLHLFFFFVSAIFLTVQASQETLIGWTKPTRHRNSSLT